MCYNGARMILLAIELLMFAFSLWLGLYLLSRNLHDARLRWAGLGLVAYAIGLGLDALIEFAGAATVPDLVTWQRPFLYLPALCWLGLLVTLLRGQPPWRQRLRLQRRPYSVILAATIFFALGLGFVLFPLAWLPRQWMLPAIGFDLVLLGVTIAMLDAFDEGETLLPHLLRSLTYAGITAFLFGGQVVLAMWFDAGVTMPLLALLLTTLAAAITIQTFSDVFQSMLDRLAFLRFPRVRNTRSELRMAAGAAPRLDDTLDLQALPREDFERLTRRALSHMGNLPKLAASPLTRLPLVNEQLAAKGESAPTLERANALKQVLTESITRLKPPGENTFGTTDAWRHYNAVFFPYVVGIRPYSRRRHDHLDEATRQALAWFRAKVPQRTLYNWQTAAARLIAGDLRERTLLGSGDRLTVRDKG